MNDSIDVLTDWEKIEGLTSWRPHFGYCFGDHVRQAKVWVIVGSYSMACHDLGNYACSKPSDYLADLKADHGGGNYLLTNFSYSSGVDSIRFRTSVRASWVCIDLKSSAFWRLKYD
jgi:hypothetical protein